METAVLLCFNSTPKGAVYCSLQLEILQEIRFNN